MFSRAERSPSLLAAPTPVVVSSGAAPVANAILRVAQASGQPVDLITHAAYIALVSVSVDHRGGRVFPDVPLLLLPRPPEIVTDGDAGFLNGEGAAVIWAASALSRSHVINRASHIGRCGLASGLIATDARRAGHSFPKAPVSILASDPAALPSDRLAVRLYDGGRTLWSDQLVADDGPVNARQTYGSDLYERITVVAHHAWCDAPGLAVSKRLRDVSVQLCRRLAVDYATVSWEIDQSRTEATLAAIELTPMGTQLQGTLDEVARALLHLLVGRHV